MNPRRWLCRTEEETIAAGREIAGMLPADALVIRITPERMAWWGEI